MLVIDVGMTTSFDEETEKFVKTDAVRVRLEHSLVSLSKWESLWETSFLGDKEKTTEQTISYIKMMLLDDNVPPDVFQKLIKDHVEEIKEYVAASMTATKLHTDPNRPSSRETVTAELIYYWMISLNVPIEFQHWHLNRLITLIRVISLKNTKPKKMSLAERRALNRQRLQEYGTRG